MDVKLANALSGYIETLYYMNQKIIKLCGTDIFYYKNDYEKLALDIIQDIPRVIPYSYSNKEKQLIYDLNDGLLEFESEIEFLKEDYEEILDKNRIILDKIRKTRNKYEHKMHGLENKSSGYGSCCLFEISFEIGLETIEISVEELIKIMKPLNNLFSKIVKEIIDFANNNQKQNYSYYERISRFDFTDFNRIYESNILHIVGKIMNDY